MRHFQICFLFLLLAFMASCDPTDTQPTDNGNNSSALTMLSLGRDSIYWGETSWILLDRDLDSIGGLSLFVGSHTMRIDSCVERKLYFRSNDNAESGAFRLYQNDRQAKGDVHVHFLAHSMEFAAFVNFGGVREAYVGETLFFEVREMPWRDGDYEFSIGNTPLKLQGKKPEGSTGSLFFSIPIGTTDGMLQARVFNDTIEFGQFTILKHQRSFQQERKINSVEIHVSNLIGKMLVRQGDSVSERERVTAQIQYAFEDLDNVTLDGDTLRLSQLKTNGGYFKLDLAIAEDQHGILSGRMAIISRLDGLETEQQMSITFKDLTWREYGDIYQCLASGPYVRDQLVSLTYKNILDGVVIEEATSESADLASAFWLTFTR